MNLIERRGRAEWHPPVLDAAAAIPRDAAYQGGGIDQSTAALAACGIVKGTGAEFILMRSCIAIVRYSPYICLNSSSIPHGEGPLPLNLQDGRLVVNFLTKYEGTGNLRYRVLGTLRSEVIIESSPEASEGECESDINICVLPAICLGQPAQCAKIEGSDGGNCTVLDTRGHQS